MRWVTASIVVVLCTLAACETVPLSYDVESTRQIREPKSVVWPRLVEFFASNNISIKTIEMASGIIAAERQITDPEPGSNIFGWADCGVSPLATPQVQTIDLNVFLRETPEGSLVTVNTRFQEYRAIAQSDGRTVSCNSTGRLERLILDAAGRDAA